MDERCESFESKVLGLVVVLKPLLCIVRLVLHRSVFGTTRSFILMSPCEEYVNQQELQRLSYRWRDEVNASLRISESYVHLWVTQSRSAVQI